MAVMDWSVRAAVPDDRERAVELMRRAFPDAEDRGADAWDWIFVGNTSGARMHYLVAEAGERLAGQYATMPVRLQYLGGARIGLLSLYTATDPDFARQGIFTKLASQLYDEASAETLLVYGFPNPNSAPGFYKKLGWVELGPFPMLLRPLGSLASVVGNRRPMLAPLGALAVPGAALLEARDRTVLAVERRRGLELRRLEAFGPWADDLWRSVSPSLGTCAVRDSAFLHWRFVESPMAYTRYVALRGGEPVGFVVTAFSGWRGRRVAHLMELMAAPGDRGAARALVAKAALGARAQGAGAMWAIATRRHPQRRALLAAGFAPLPDSLTKTFSFGVRVFGDEREELRHVDDWYLSGADLDYV
jgi:GNAT superfamily N-acetyltransferase